MKVCKGLLILLLLVLVIGTAMASSSDEENPKDNEPSKDITGYGDFILGTGVSELDLSDLEGPITDTSYENVKSINYVQLDRSFKHSAGNTKVNLMLTFVDDKLAGIMLNFKSLILDIGDLDDVKQFVKGLRSSIKGKYDIDLVETDVFGFEYSTYSSSLYLEGALALKDEEGNMLLLNWDGYDLSLSYISSSFVEILFEAQEKAEKKEEDKL